MVTGGKKTQQIEGTIAVDTTGLATTAKQDEIITAIQAIPAGGGTQYTEADVDATIVGTAMLGETTGNALAPVQLDGSNNVKVAVQGTVPVSGTFYQATQPVSGTVTAIAQPGVDIGDVTINNASIPVTDNAGSLTIDAPVGTPVFVRLSDGASAITTLPVSLASVPSHAVTATDLDIRNLVNTDVVTAELSAVDNAVLDTIAAKDFATQTTLAAMNTKFVSGTDIGDVTINNASGASAVNIQDGGNAITVDAVDLDVRNLVFATDKVDTSGSTVQDVPATTGGLSKFHLVGAATTNATNVKASAGQVYAITAFNVAATPAYLKFHNTAGTPTAGSGVTDTFLIPGNTAGAGMVLNIDKGIAFATGIGITLVTGIADANASAIAADNVVINIYYK
jgi:hypothetical protein